MYALHWSTPSLYFSSAHRILSPAGSRSLFEWVKEVGQTYLQAAWYGYVDVRYFLSDSPSTHKKKKTPVCAPRQKAAAAYKQLDSMRLP